MTVITEWTTLDMTSDDCDYEGRPPWTIRLMTVITEVDHLGPGSLMTVIGNGPAWTMTSDGCDYGVDNLRP